MLDKLLSRCEKARMLWIAIASQLSAPVPKNLNSWFDYRDVPESVMRGGSGAWRAGVRVYVAPDGNINSCEVETSSKVAVLDRLSCGLVQRRAKFESAHWKDGTPAYGVYRTSVSWSVDEPGRQQPFNADLDLFVKALPSGIKSPSLVRVMFAVDLDGSTSSCTAEPAKGFERAENNPRLVPIACEQLMKNYRPVPVTDASGVPVRSVQDALVRFSTGAR